MVPLQTEFVQKGAAINSGTHKHVDEREVIDLYPERANLYHLKLTPVPTKVYHVREDVGGRVRDEIHLDPVADAEIMIADVREVRRALQNAVLEAIEQAGFPISRRSLIPLAIDIGSGRRPFAGMATYSGYELRVMSFGDDYFLCLDHHLVVQSRMSLATLTNGTAAFRPRHFQRLHVRRSDEWAEASFLDIGPMTCDVILASGDRVSVPLDDIVPTLTHDQLQRLAPSFGARPQELERQLRQLAFLTVGNAPRARLDASSGFAERLEQEVFPITVGETTIQLDSVPAKLRPPSFSLSNDLAEPAIALDRIDRSKRVSNITRGLVSFGAYEQPMTAIRLVVITTNSRVEQMDALVRRLNSGSHQYAGAQQTFGTEFVVREHVICPSVDDYEHWIRDFVQTGAREETDVALVYLPKTGDPSSPDHPYYTVKRLLLREGLASQMVDEPTVLNPDWRDLNLALNLYAKAGYTPWVLDEPMPGVDLFIGLSSSRVTRGNRIIRLMGYVNVFDAYGRWRFYRGHSTAFPFEDRLRYFRQLVRDSVAAYRAENGGSLSSVQVHLTKRFSAEERQVLAEAVRTVVPDAIVTFVWINPHHILRLYDVSDGSDGAIGRGTYVWGEPSGYEPSRAFVATTGTNAFGQRGMGTPIPLQLTVWSDPADNGPALREVIQHVFSLTRLNWSSSRNFCHEPITTKFAGDIARSMTAFMEDPDFFVNPSLRKVPWFL